MAKTNTLPAHKPGTTPMPGTLWQHPFGRMFKIEAAGTMLENGLGHRWGPMVTLQAVNNKATRMMVYQHELDQPVQLEMLV